VRAAPRCALGLLWTAVSATAVPVGAAADDFYRGKEITLHVGSGPGGAYDTFGRLLSRHLGRHIPGSPNVVVVNVPGASGRRMINYIYNVAPKDGTAVGSGLSTLAFDPLTGEDSQFDAQKLEWIGSSNKETSACIVWHGSPIRTIGDVRVRRRRSGRAVRAAPIRSIRT
jgi:tripartite-type tricarboxylate transporter receptor subunit TctC